MPRYKSKMKLHLGETGDVLLPGEVIEFNGGNTLIRTGGKEVTLQYPDAMLGAVKAGWLVPENEEAGEYVPQPAGVEVRSATSTGENRTKLTVVTVQDEERGIGHIGDVREAANDGRGDVPEVHQASDAAKTRTASARDAGGDEGVVVSRFKSSARSAPVEIGKDDRQVKQALDNKSTIEIEKVSVATGDVEEARSGETLEDLLPNAATSGTPAKPQQPADLMAALRQALADGTLDPEALAALTQAKAPEPAPATQKVDWDLSTHWKQREAKALNEFGDNPTVLRAILDLENSNGVKKAIQSRLEALGA